MKRFVAFAVYERNDVADRGTFCGDFDSIEAALRDSGTDGNFLDVLDIETLEAMHFVRDGSAWTAARTSDAP